MWSERDQGSLAVWADQLQDRGEPLGELVAVALTLDLAPPADAAQLEALRVRRAALEAAVHGPVMAEFADAHPAMDFVWEHGVISSIRVVDHGIGRSFGQALLDPLRALLRLPVARFVQTLRVDARGPNWWPIHPEVPALLLEPEVLARPRTLIFGAAPTNAHHHTGPEAIAATTNITADLLELDRGVRSLYVAKTRIDLPWQRGDKGTRRAAIAGLVDELTTAPSPVIRTRFARALWDPSARVRLRALDALPLLGVDAAPLIPELLLVKRGEAEWLTRVREVLATLAQNPAIVGAVARNFDVDQPQAGAWVASSPLAVAQAARPRIQAMLEPGGGTQDFHGRQDLTLALAKLERHADQSEQKQQLDPRTPTSRPLLARLRRWWG